MLPRTLEPEVMDTPDEAADYNSMDHSVVNMQFVTDFLTEVDRSAIPGNRLFDAGTGTALIPIELARRGRPLQIVASDLAGEMLDIARVNVDSAGFANIIQLVQSDCKQLPDADATFDAVMSNSIVHHIPEPKHVLAELWRILKPGGLLFVRDLMRPDNASEVNRLVDRYAGEANAHQRQMFHDSLHAALAVAEVRSLIEPLGIAARSVEATSDRHWTLIARRPE